MARQFTAAMLTELAKPGNQPAFLAEIEFVSGPLHLWTGIGNLVWDSKTFQGVGHFAGISEAGESAEVKAANFVLSLSGIPLSLLGQALGEIRHHKQATVWIALLDAAGEPIADPQIWAQGFTDHAQVEESGETATIALNCETEDAILQRAKERRYTPEDQKAEFPGDKGFDDVPSLGELNLVWGGKKIPITTGGGGGSGGGGGDDGRGRLERFEEPRF